MITQNFSSAISFVILEMLFVAERKEFWGSGECNKLVKKTYFCSRSYFLIFPPVGGTDSVWVCQPVLMGLAASTRAARFTILQYNKRV